MRLLISLSALLISTLFVQMGIGSLRPFDAISVFWRPAMSPDFFSAVSSARTWCGVPVIRVPLR